MALGKKGMYFTVMTIAFLVIFTFVFMLPSYRRSTEKMAAVELRVDSMDDFVKGLQRDAGRALYISSYRAVMALEAYILSHGTFLDDSEARFMEALLNGTVEGVNSSLMKDSRLPDWIARIVADSTALNIISNITVLNVEIYQDDPWYITVAANMTFFIQDSTSIASWNINRNIITRISIVGFEDPLYVVNTYGRLTNAINITHYEGNYTYESGGIWYVDNFMEHVSNGYYSAHLDAPNFIMRFENNMSNSSSGIESIVDLTKLNAQGLQINTGSSIVDYYYWQAASNGDFRVNNTPSWVVMDEDHLSKYQLLSVSYPE